MSATAELDMNDTALTSTFSTDVTAVTRGAYAECEDVTCARTALEAADMSVCGRLAPPPVPPWLQDAPSRLHEMTRHCRSWNAYHELCQQGAVNSTWTEAPEDRTAGTEIMGHGTRGVQWVIPVLALVVVVLLVMLAAIMYKYYRHPSTRAMYRVAGGGSPLKRPTVPGGWGDGAVAESEMRGSNLSAGCTHASGLRYTRSPVCRLLEHTQYVATPTEARVRQHASGAPAFTCPAYFLPALSWLRLPVLQHVWPKEAPSDTGDATLYNAAQSAPTSSGEIIYRWPNGDSIQRGEGGGAEEPEYSEIWEAQQLTSDIQQNVSGVTDADICGCTCAPASSPLFLARSTAGPRDLGLGHYQALGVPAASSPHLPSPDPLHNDYRHHRCHGACHHLDWHNDNGRSKSRERGAAAHLGGPPVGCPPNKTGDLGLRHVARRDTPLQVTRGAHSGIHDHGMEAWLAQYKLPSGCMPQCTMRHDSQWLEEGLLLDDLPSDSELLLLEQSSLPTCAVTERASLGVGQPSRLDSAGQVGDRQVVKYPNVLYEGCGHVTTRNNRRAPRSAPSPLVSRLWDFLGRKKR